MGESLSTEILVIGWGKAGKTLAGVLGRAGRSVTVVEQSPTMVGGTCINIACVPTKDLIHSAWPTSPLCRDRRSSGRRMAS